MHRTVLVRLVVVVIVVACCSFLPCQQALMLVLLPLTFANCTFGGSDLYTSCLWRLSMAATWCFFIQSLLFLGDIIGQRGRLYGTCSTHA